MMETQLSEGRLDGASKNKWGLFEEDVVATALNSLRPTPAPDSPLFVLVEEHSSQEAALQPRPLKTLARLPWSRHGHSPD